MWSFNNQKIGYVHFLIWLKKKIPGSNSLAIIDRFRSRGQQLCKLIGAKDPQKKNGATPLGLLENINIAAIILFWYTNMADVKLIENAL